MTKTTDGKSGEGAIRESAAIESLISSQGVRQEEVRALYESILSKMKEEAIILDFLPIFAARQVKELLEVGNSGDAEELEGPA